MARKKKGSRGAVQKACGGLGLTRSQWATCVKRGGPTAAQASGSKKTSTKKTTRKKKSTRRRKSPLAKVRAAVC